ncbi:hypothetical protein VSDG_09189 [Cytospora chrysosperma]|uniref:FAD/NAD(P)-binding domain-containing protein n=1 Tax=Cytospora chrysosperma TaxID=252740 RepID=A0A423VAQ8_CYTCH|nr:hypothetical protein VSDG_09189 [Valsa sordida]
MSSQETPAHSVAAGVLDAAATIQKYTEEAQKRVALRQGKPIYSDLQTIQSERFHSLAKDPWADHDALNAREPPLKDGDKTKVLILGGGFGALTAAIRLIQQGFDVNDIKLVDSAGGFGGTWYWNRYPGLHCDVESYVYLPFLEETGYVPKWKYSPGYEILEHTNRIAAHWNLTDKALFRTTVTDLTWDEDNKDWTVGLTEDRGPGKGAHDIKVKAQYFIIAAGLLSRPHIPNITGLESFAGDMFHTSRWDWAVTGGTPTDPDMGKLKDKRVGIIGTGATAIQAVPHLARHAKELFVFQRTPSAVSPREQQHTDPEEWKTKIATHKGWHAERRENFARRMNRSLGPDEINMVDDWWTRIDGYHAIVGSPRKGRVPPTPEAIGAHIAEFVGLDLPYGERTRARVDEIVKDKDTATKLKAWYPSWCKRPTFSDEYLQSFNLPNVHLVDTDGRGIDSATEKGLVFEGKEYPLDVLVLSTGYVGPSTGQGNPATMPNIRLSGRDGSTLEDKFQRQGPTTLHGIMSHSCPNLFWFGGLQTGSTVNFVHMVDVQATHLAHILGEAKKRGAATVEASVEGEEGWSTECATMAAWYAMIPMCTPGYLNSEGASFGKPPPAPEEAFKAARGSAWAEGLLSYEKVLAEWWSKGDLAGVLMR